MPAKKPTITQEDLDALHVLVADRLVRRGWDRAWKVFATAAWAVGIVVLGWYLTRNANLRDEAAVHREKARAEVVDKKLKVVEDVADVVTKALAPEAFTTKAAK
jgi:hypothetical protein